MKKIMEYYNISYQEFWEDKILLIEYDMTPNELINSECAWKLLGTNNQRYHIWYMDYGYEIKNRYHQSYKIEIYFSLKSLLKHVIYDNWRKKIVNHLLDHMHLMGTRHSKSPRISYEHNVYLSWEEIMDKVYIDFIIQSISIYVRDFLKGFGELIDKEFDETPIESINILVFNNFNKP